MKIDNRLLKLKQFSPLQKLILGLIMDEPTIVLLYAGGCNKTCGEIGKELGVSRAKIKIEFDDLIKNGYITSKIEGWGRISNLTPKLIELING